MEDLAAADVPVCTLLSGGIDSAAVAFFLTQAIPRIVAYTAVLDPRAQDLRCARLVADTLGIELQVVSVPPPSADDLARVVHCIEMPFKAQVEIGWACLKLAERMRADGFKVTRALLPAGRSVESAPEQDDARLLRRLATSRNQSFTTRSFVTPL